MIMYVALTNTKMIIKDDVFFKLTDGTGKAPKFVIWGHPGNDVTGMIARSEKVVNLSEKVRLLLEYMFTLYM